MMPQSMNKVALAYSSRRFFMSIMLVTRNRSKSLHSGTSIGLPLRLIVAALFTSRSGGPSGRISAAHARTAPSSVTSTTEKPFGCG